MVTTLSYSVQTFDFNLKKKDKTIWKNVTHIHTVIWIHEIYFVCDSNVVQFWFNCNVATFAVIEYVYIQCQWAQQNIAYLMLIQCWKSSSSFSFPFLFHRQFFSLLFSSQSLPSTYIDSINKMKSKIHMSCLFYIRFSFLYFFFIFYYFLSKKNLLVVV